MEKGGITKKGSKGLAYLHEKEMVATKPMTKDIINGVKAMSVNAQMTPDITNALNDLSSMYNPSFGGQVGNTYGMPGSPIKGKGKGAAASGGAANGEGVTGDLRLGTYNVLFSSDNNGTKADLAKLFTKADVLALTEFVGEKRQLQAWIEEQGWGVSGNAGDSAVLWNKAKYKRTDQGSRKLNDKVPPGPGKDRFANWTRLQDVNTGKEFVQVAAHTSIPKASFNAARSEQFANLTKLVEELKGGGTPVFVSGDFNADSGKAKYNGASNFGFGLNHTRSKQGTIGSVGTVFDYIFSSIGKLTGSSLMNGSSDHRALLQQFNIPSFKTGGDISVGGLANLHAEERVLTSQNTKRLDDGLNNLANGVENKYTIIVNPSEGMNEETLANAVIKKIDAREARLPQNRRGKS
jgi:endonuclease/exonuclease/phosphatase (EEP) superfamily protein YafD